MTAVGESRRYWLPDDVPLERASSQEECAQRTTRVAEDKERRGWSKGAGHVKHIGRGIAGRELQRRVRFPAL